MWHNVCVIIYGWIFVYKHICIFAKMTHQSRLELLELLSWISSELCEVFMIIKILFKRSSNLSDLFSADLFLTSVLSTPQWMTIVVSHMFIFRLTPVYWWNLIVVYTMLSQIVRLLWIACLNQRFFFRRVMLDIRSNFVVAGECTSGNV